MQKFIIVFLAVASVSQCMAAGYKYLNPNEKQNSLNLKLVAKNEELKSGLGLEEGLATDEVLVLEDKPVDIHTKDCDTPTPYSDNPSVAIVKKDDVIEIPETTTVLPETAELQEITPYAAAAVCPIVPDCTVSDRSEILFPPIDSECKKFTKLVVPIEMAIISKIPSDDIIELMTEANPAVMLSKLLKLVEKY